MKNRSQVLEAINQREFDLVVVGGGVVGAGVAQDAASRGLSVLVIEKDDFASGTSSRTTKLIHGGLRYLEQFHFRLTRELCQERGLLEQLAPHMVRDFSFILPVTRQRAFFGLKADIGLTLYDILSINARGVRRHERLSRKATVEAVPSLDGDSVTGALRFHDCITDDARIVTEVLKAADSLGASIINYVEARNFELEDNQIRRVIARDRMSGRELVISCRACVNAAGVWTDGLMQQYDAEWRNRCKPAKGTHIMLPLSAFETSSALFLPTDDKRYVFVVPWQKALMVGTTDTAYDGPLDDPQPTIEEIDYLLAILNRYARARPNGKQIERDEVIASWSGLRPLVSEPGESTSDTSREHSLFTGPGGMIGLIGGKLTNYRILAGHVVDSVMEQLKRRMPGEYLNTTPSTTGEMMLGGWVSRQDYLTSTAQISARGRKLALEPATIDHLTASYGKDALAVMDIVESSPELAERICPDFPPIMAETLFVMRQEMAVSLEDILSRRIRLGFVHREQCLTAAPRVARLVGAEAGWDNQRVASELGHLAQNMATHLTPQAQEK